jgi:hypothetical protein
MHPYGGSVEDLQHPAVWIADEVAVPPEFQCKGIATSLYAHVHVFGYQVGPSDLYMGGDDAGGRRLWEHLDPGLIDRKDEGQALTVTAAFTERDLNKLIAKFGCPANPDEHPEFHPFGPLDIRMGGFTDWP